MSKPNRLSNEGMVSAVLFGVVLLVLWPTFSNGLSVGHDMETHYYRIAQLVLNVQEGEPFSQWARYAMRGYGYPILMFYAPLFYWLVALVHFVGFSLSAAMRVVIVGELFLAGWGGYRLARLYYRPYGAFIAGVAYLFAPYILYDATERGAFPELLGLVLIPFVLTSLDHLLAQPTRRQAIQTTGWVILTLLSHNVVPFFLFPLMALFMVTRLLLEEQGDWSTRIKKVWLCGGVVLLSLGATFLFWFPALIELSFTQSRVAGSTLYSWPYFESHFVTWRQALVWPVEPIDYALDNRPLVRGVGIGQAVLAAVSLLFLFKRQTRYWSLIAWLGVALLSFYLLQPLSIAWWRMLPLPTYIQLPSRFLGTASLACALLVGFVVDQLIYISWPLFSVPTWAKLTMQSIALGIFAVLVSFSGVSWFYPIYGDVPLRPTAEQVVDGMDWNEDGRIDRWGAAASGETLPQWVSQLPPAEGLFASDTVAAEVQRLQRSEFVQVDRWESSPSGDLYELETAEPTHLVYQTFYFPGWQVRINGQTAPIVVTELDGFISFELPAGQHLVDIRFGRTPLRWLALAISSLSVVLLFVVWRWPLLDSLWRRVAITPPDDKQIDVVWPLLMVTLVLLGGRFIVDRTDNFLRADRLLEDGRLTQVDIETNIHFGQEFAHLGVVLPDVVVRDEPFTVVQYWRPLRDIGVPYGFGLRVADDNGRVWSLPEIARPIDFIGYPMLGWNPSVYVRDPYILQLEAGIPPGEYWLEAEVFQRHVAFALRPDRQAGVDPAQARIGKIQVVGGNEGGLVDGLNYQVETFAPTSVRSDMQLLGWTVRDGIWRPGEQGALDLLWAAQVDHPEPMNGAVVLSDAVGNEVVRYPFELGSGYPLDALKPQELLRDKLIWPLPAGLPSGRLQLSLHIDEQRIVLGEVKAEIPDRLFSPPEMAYAQTDEARLGFAQLIGHDLVQDGDQIQLFLHWQAVAETESAYRVFVHFRDQTEQIRAQSDNVPAEWTRPTTSWLEGEYISDRHILRLPPGLPAGLYEIYVGIYDDRTGERLGEYRLTEMVIE